MTLLTIAFTLLFYFATATIVAGLVYRIRLYARTPAPLRIPTTPAPTTQAGVIITDSDNPGTHNPGRRHQTHVFRNHAVQ
jgi:hypothetical protein